MLKITHTNKNGENIPVMVFRNERDGRVFYNIGLSRKKVDGLYENGNMLAQFNKDVDIPNQTKILLTNAVLDFYKKEDKITVPFIRVFDYELENTSGNKEAESKFIEIPSGEDLPF